ncbi:circumsporozoite protein-like isoform X2 [Papaver somniferum]|nr:circumsporozoite protein-like isoform X2 [Papaver somniferum]
MNQWIMDLEVGVACHQKRKEEKRKRRSAEVTPSSEPTPQPRHGKPLGANARNTSEGVLVITGGNDGVSLTGGNKGGGETGGNKGGGNQGEVVSGTNEGGGNDGLAVTGGNEGGGNDDVAVLEEMKVEEMKVEKIKVYLILMKLALLVVLLLIKVKQWLRRTRRMEKRSIHQRKMQVKSLMPWSLYLRRVIGDLGGEPRDRSVLMGGRFGNLQ